MSRTLKTRSDVRHKVTRKRGSTVVPRAARSVPAGTRSRMRMENEMARKPAKDRGSRPALRSEAERELAQRMLTALQSGADLRVRKVRRVKAAIKVRAYENDLKFEVAFERLRLMVAGMISPGLAKRAKTKK
jgi:hypothetical protein